MSENKNIQPLVNEQVDTYQPIPTDKVFTEQLRKYKTTDRGHADVFNANEKVLINNDAYLKEQVDTIKSNASTSNTQINTAIDNHKKDTNMHVTLAKQQAWDAKASTAVATSSSNGLMSAADKQAITNLSNTINTTVTGQKVLTEIKKVDGSGSGLDADLLDGKDSSAFSLANHTHVAASATANGFMTAQQVTDLNTAKTAVNNLGNNYASKNHSHSNATTTTNGFMTAQQVTDLNTAKTAIDNMGSNDKSNIAIGKDTLKSNTTGYSNIAMGPETLESNTSGYNNVALGAAVLSTNTSGYCNVAIGQVALAHNKTGNNNVAIGCQTFINNDTGCDNIAIGTICMANNSSGSNNIAIGHSSLDSNSTGNHNIAIGPYALSSTMKTSDNIAIGYYSLSANKTAERNTAVGSEALKNNIGGWFNTAVGWHALHSLIEGQANTAVGSDALINNTTGSYNTAVGWHTIATNTIGHSNTAVGCSALSANETGNYNTAVGYAALNKNTTGGHNTAVGNNALQCNTTGQDNIAVGRFALNNNTSGIENIAIGCEALSNGTRGARTIAIGQEAIAKTPGGNSNIAIGYRAILFNNYGSRNIAIGELSLGGDAYSDNNIPDVLPTIGEYNVCLGHGALSYLQYGVKNISIGNTSLTYQINGTKIQEVDNCIGIGPDSRVSGDNQVQIGVSGQTVYGASTYNVRSDARDKADIQDLTYNAYEFIKKIKPRNFRWNRREDYESEEIISVDEYESADEKIREYCIPVTLTEREYNELKSDKEYYTKFIEEPKKDEKESVNNSLDESNTEEIAKPDRVSYKAYKFHYQYMSDESKKGKRLHNGFIAQEVKAVADEMGFDFAGFQDHKVNGGCDVYTLGYEQFIAPMVSAMQVMMKQIEELKNEIEILKQKQA